MSARSAERDQLLLSLDEIIRKVGAQAVLISDLVATRVGLNPTDLECLDLLHLDGPTTAGQVSARSGLTTGATTAVIDRLERAGFVKRSRDPQDRRVVRVEVLDHCGPHIEPMYQPLKEGLDRVNARYTNSELEVVVRYFSEALEAGATHVAWLQTQPALSHRRLRLHGGNESFGHAAPPAPARSVTTARRPRLRQRRQEHDRGAARRK